MVSDCPALGRLGLHQNARNHGWEWPLPAAHCHGEGGCCASERRAPLGLVPRVPGRWLGGQGCTWRGRWDGGAAAPGHSAPHLLTHPTGPERICGVVRSESIRVAGAGTDNRQARSTATVLSRVPALPSPSCCCFVHVQGWSRPSDRTWEPTRNVPAWAGVGLAGARVATRSSPWERSRGQTQAPASPELLVAEAFCMDRGPREGAPRACGPPGWEGVCRRVRGPEA